MSDSYGIKELSEALDALKSLAVTGAKVGKDGKIGADDLAHLVEFLQNIDVVIAGFKGIGDIKLEVKDLKEDEVLVLVAKVFSIIKEIKEVVDDNNLGQ